MVQWSPRLTVPHARLGGARVAAEGQSASALCLSGLRPVMCREERARDLQTPECTLLVQLISSQL